MRNFINALDLRFELVSNDVINNALDLKDWNGL